VHFWLFGAESGSRLAAMTGPLHHHGGKRARLSFFPFVVLGLVCSVGPDPALALAEHVEYEPDVILIIKEKAFHMLKGTPSAEHAIHPGFSLPSGAEITLELRNEDHLPHEFVSPLFAKVEFQFWGKATLVYTHTANGIRIDPGEVVALRFELPKDFNGDLFKFWCNLHGKLHGDMLQGEIFVVEPKQG
jgi:hypothetical protein